jgi:uncharacterized protein (TIGR01777 family)
MKIFMTGGTGFVGTSLTEKLAEDGHEITILTRKIKSDKAAPEGVTFVEGNPTEEEPWQEELKNHEVVINLAGASIMGLWTESRKKEIIDSRVLTTRNIVNALAQSSNKDIQLFNTSAVGYYGFHKEEVIDEENGPGKGFLSEVARKWESEAQRASDLGNRVVICRYGIILGEKGGMLETMIPVFKINLGGGLGTGKQWVSWIHVQDIANIYKFLLENKDITGPVNCTSPHPVRNEEMAKILAQVLGKKNYMPNVPGFVIKTLLGEFSSIMLEGQKVLPKRLIKNGFTFQYPHLKGALENILSHMN